MNLRQRLDELRALEQKATPGEWLLSDMDIPPIVYVHMLCDDGEIDEPPVAVVDDGTISRIGVEEMEANARLIAALRNTIGPLLDVVEAQNRALSAMADEKSGTPKECGHEYECACAYDAALAALALMDKEEA